MNTTATTTDIGTEQKNKETYEAVVKVLIERGWKRNLEGISQCLANAGNRARPMGLI